MPQHNMPKGWEPPYPSWSAQFQPDIDTVVVGYFAAQYRSGNAAGFKQWMESALTGDNAPQHYEQASYVDEAGHTNHVYICYWTQPDHYQCWAAAPQVMEWWHDPGRQQGATGYWREVIFAPMARLETLFSSEDSAGMAKLTESFGSPIKEHGYWGGMRDRIAASEHDDFGSKAGGELACLPSVQSRGKRVRISPPENICLIRSAQNWTQCQGSELDLYLKDVHPVLIEGMNFIRDNPLETGCISCRFMDELSKSGDKQPKTFGMAYFLTMAHLESWVRSHPTHLAIFQSFHKMVQQLNFQLDLKLWHEVIVLPEGPHIFEYLNCHEQTGLLPYFSPASGVE